MSSALSCLRLERLASLRGGALRRCLASAVVAALATFVRHTPPAAPAPAEAGSSLGLTIALVVIGMLAVVAIVAVVIIRQRKSHRRSTHHGHGPPVCGSPRLTAFEMRPNAVQCPTSISIGLVRFACSGRV